MAKKTTVKTANLPQHVRAEQKTESACRADALRPALSGLQNENSPPQTRQAVFVGVEKKEEREERKEKIGLLTSMSIPANHVRTVNESERICEHFLRFIPNYCTFFVAMISTPVPAAFESNTSPIFTGACAVT